ncbi:MAG TPA: hypothetical protein VFO77_07310 [Actinoplanes sp.]|nr:hypothetical protein [Actinoplanes sp.]
MPLTPAAPVRQLSLFSVEAVAPAPTDLAGLLAGPGRLDRMGGTARVTVPVDAAWRVHALIPELVLRGFTASWSPIATAAPDNLDETTGDGFEVRTAYSSRLSGLGRAWLDGTAKRPPERFFLSGPRLRLWAVAAGSMHPGGYQLGLGPDDTGHGWEIVDAALTRAGVPGVVLEPVAAYRITGRRRLARLAELVGERPAAAPAEHWPGG